LSDISSEIPCERAVARKLLLSEFHAARYEQTVEPLSFSLPARVRTAKKTPVRKPGFPRRKEDASAPLDRKNEIPDEIPFRIEKIQAQGAAMLCY
jgi:hypothetical protein